MLLKEFCKKLKRLRSEIILFIVLTIFHTLILSLIAYILILFNVHQIDLSNVVLNINPDIQIKIPL